MEKQYEVTCDFSWSVSNGAAIKLLKGTIITVMNNTENEVYLSNGIGWVDFLNSIWMFLKPVSSKKLSIEEWKPQSEKENDLIKWEHVGYYFDIKSHICVYKMKVSQELIVGKKYDFTFEDEFDTDTYTYLILAHDPYGFYYMIEYNDNDEAITKKESLLGDAWTKCDVLELLGINLQSYISK